MKRLFCLFASSYALLSHAQEFKWNLSDKFKLPEYSSVVKSGDFFYSMEMDLSGAQIGYFATLKNASHAIELHQYDANMKEMKDVKLEDGKKNFGPFTSRLIKFNEKLLLLYFRYNDDTSKLFMSEVDAGTLTLINSKLLLSMFQRGSINPLGPMSRSINTIFTAQTPDRSKLLVAYSNDKQIGSCIIDKDLIVSRLSVQQHPVKDLALEGALIDNKENKYLTYVYEDGKTSKKGIYIQNKSGKEVFTPFNMGNDEYQPSTLSLKNSADNSKVYAFADYSGKNGKEGVVLATVDANKPGVIDTKLIPYSGDIKEKLLKIGWAEKSKGFISLHSTTYELVDDNSGTLALIGQSAYSTDNMSMSGRSWISYNAGPIIGIFMHGEDTNFIMIPRKEIAARSATVMAFAYNKKIMCVYSENEKFIEDENASKKSMKTVIAVSVFDSTGYMVSQKMIGEYPTGSSLALSSHGKISDGNFLFPVFTTTTGMDTYHTRMTRWASLTIQ